MKRFFFLLILILIQQQLSAQEAVDYPLNWFIKLSPTIYTVNSVPAEIDFQFKDDDSIFPDSIATIKETNSLWTYGANLDISYLLPKDFTISINNYFGFGQNFTTYTTQLAFGREFPFKKFYIQPSIGLGFIYSRLKIGEFDSENKEYFEVNDWYIYEGLTVRMKSRAFSINPAVTIEYPIKNHLSLFAKVTAAYTFGKANYLTFSGETDEIDEEGNYVITYENRNFDHENINLAINGRELSSRQSPFLHYNFNALQLQFGISIRLVEVYYE